MRARRGRLFIISAPSGSGKTTLCQKLIKRVPGLKRSVSCTTRHPRRGEKDGRDYIFLTRREFKRRVAAKMMLEWAVNFGQYYGTPKGRVRRLLSRGLDLLLAIDVKGAMKVKKLCPEAVLIFIAPPTIAELRKRLKGRRTDGGAEIAKRIRIAKKELSYLPRYDYCVVNDSVGKAVKKLQAILYAERCRIG